MNLSVPGSESPTWVAALDVGGSSIKGAVYDPDLQPVLNRRWPTEAVNGPDAVLARILTAAEELVDVAPHSVAAVGVVVPGIVAEDEGVAIHSVNLGWRDVPLRDLLEQRLGLPVGFGHDVRAGGVAEATLGAGVGCRHLLFVPVGTGVAAAIVRDGVVWTGDGAAGELGHVVVDPWGPRCACGQRGCVEALAGARAIADRYFERAGHRIESDEVVRRAAGGDVMAEQAWAEAIEALAAGLASAVALLAPDRLVIGGGVASAGVQLLGPLAVALADRLSFRAAPELTSARFGPDAGRVGAALLARNVLSPAVAQP